MRLRTVPSPSEKRRGVQLHAWTQGGITSRSRLSIDFPTKRSMLEFFEELRAHGLLAAFGHLSEDKQCAVFRVDPKGATFNRLVAPAAWFHVSDLETYPKKQMVTTTNVAEELSEELDEGQELGLPIGSSNVSEPVPSGPQRRKGRADTEG